MRLRFPVIYFFFCALLKVACRIRFAGVGDGFKVRPRLLSSFAAVFLPPLELVSKGWLFFRVTCSDR